MHSFISWKEIAKILMNMNAVLLVLSEHERSTNMKI